MVTTYRRATFWGVALAAALVAGCAADETPTAVPRALGAADTATSPPTSPPPESTTTTTEPPRGPIDRPPVLADDPAGIAAQLTAAEQAVRNPATGDDEVVEQAHVAQYAYRVLATRPEWDDEVRAVLPPELHQAFDANIAARRELRGMHTHLLETLPAWRIIEPPPYDELLGHYQEAQEIFGVPWEYLAAIHLVETAIGRVDGVSVAGAQGPMQFMPGTWDAFGEGDVRNHRDAIHAAARYLRHSGAPGDMRSAIFAYNRHYNYVRAVEHFASVIRHDPAAFRGYYHWQVYVLTAQGDVVMPLGYEATERIPVEEYLASLD